ncbi:MAG: bifunctional precorrin-2 dehydrogenase/sirohydrochlorin ferrochelatase [Methanosphaera sp.]|nr:bifunctional precorrin-2 dehydrogenase/sirohydrochlorin ferrochelatase [Methanosphaera sp.]
MGLTSLFLEMSNKNVLIVGTGSVGIRRSNRFLDADANVTIITKHIDENMKEELLSKGAHFHSEDELDYLLDWCDLVVVATNDLELNEKISLKASNKLVNCASDISLSNVIVPSTFDIGSVTISLYTGSKSPLMAKELRKKIQSIITEEDILNIELQEYIRNHLKTCVDSQVDRKAYMEKLNEDPTVKEYISNHDLESAKNYVDKYIEQVK